MPECYIHKGIEADKVCSVCGRYCCDGCSRENNGKIYCVDILCRREILTNAKQKIMFSDRKMRGDYAKAAKFIRRNAVTLILFGLFNLLISYSGCNRADYDLSELNSAMEIMRKYSGQISSLSTDINKYLEEMVLMTEKLNKLSVYWDMLSIFAIICGALLFTQKNYSRIITSSLLFISILFTVYFTWLNYFIMRRMSELILPGGLSSLSQGMNIIPMLIILISAITVFYFIYLLYRLNSGNVKELFM